MALVSVVMPVYNSANYLQEAIQSILRQTYQELELIIVDDGSSDISPQLIREYQALDERVRPLFLGRDSQRYNGGHATNQGIALARGDYIARLDSDDIALPHRIESQLNWIRRTGCDICGSNGDAFGDREYPYRFPSGHEAIKNELLFRICLFGSAVMMRAHIARNHPFATRSGCDDYEYWTRLASHYRLGNVPEVLLRYRYHNYNSHNMYGEKFMRDVVRYRFRYFYTLFPGTPLDEYLIFARVAERAPMPNVAALNQAGLWLVALAQPYDGVLRKAMLRRWEESYRCTIGFAPESETIYERIRLELARLVAETDDLDI